ncbi:unnamed protein product [Meganyctiphanes norvegica]|uniref:C-type lectin domain-containing protein n=1 Tax=Meganyctiphanes norvegica TaxID=48144 RepID=A0AAV2RD57_MEGNR
MDWHWYATVLILCILQREYAKACDDDFKRALLQDFEHLLDNKLNPMNIQMTQINDKLATIETKLELLEGTTANINTSTESLNGRNSELLVGTTGDINTSTEGLNGRDNELSLGTAGDINTSTDDLNVRSSERQIAADVVKKMQETLMTKLDAFDESISEIKSASNDSFQELNNIKSFIEDNLTIVKNDISIILDDVKQVIFPIRDMAESILKIQQNTEYFKVPITELRYLENESNALLKGIKERMEVYKVPSTEIMTQSVNIIEKIEDSNRNRIETEDMMLNLLLMLTAGVERCPDGVFVSTQCFNAIRDHPCNWTEAEKRCKSQGLVLAEPSDIAVVPLRRFLLQRYGEATFWVNAKGHQRKFMWGRANKALEGDSSLWSPGHPGDRVTPLHCLSLLSWEDDWRSSPGQPYHSEECSNSFNYPLCERLLQDTETFKSPIKKLEEFTSKKLDSMEQKMIDSDEFYRNSFEKIFQDTQLMKDPVLALEQKLSTKMESVKANISATLEKCNTHRKKINLTAVLSTNPDAFCLSTQCFLLMKDVKTNWTNAVAKCEERGFILAQPTDEVAVTLRQYIHKKFGNKDSWLGAKSDGSNYVWQNGGKLLMADNSLWFSRNTNTGQCLELDADQDPPFHSTGCSNSGLNPLCELI